VLIAGGAGDATAEIYDPSTGAFTVTGSMSTPRSGASSTLLPDGRVLIVGGNPPGTTNAELYDPALGLFVNAGNLTYPSGGYSAILLLNGKVLILGSDGAEIYDPDTGLFTPTGPYVGNGGCDLCAPSTRLADGRVLFLGQNQPQLYDPATGTFSLTGSMLTGGIIDSAADTLLMSGKVLFAGGADSDNAPLSDAELYDPGTGIFSSTGHMLLGRYGHTLTLLPDGKVLAAGGETGKCGPGGCYFPGTGATAELYDPASGAFSATGNMIAPREGHTATLLNDGRVLLTGGEDHEAPYTYVPTASAEVYTPALLPTGPPSVSGVQSISLFGGSSAVAPGSWIEVHGSNLVGVSRSWTLADFNGVVAPTSLEGTSVAIGGQRAAIALMSPTMLLVQVPSQVAPGSQPLVVTTAVGVTSPFTVTVNPLEPGVYAPAFLQVGGNQLHLRVQRLHGVGPANRSVRGHELAASTLG
jgi:hypothetical protein